jgi:hypothetical protein
VAGKIGETAATALIHSVLETANPDIAFTKILKNVVELSGKHIPFLAHLSLDNAYLYFSNLIDELDQDDSLYRREALFDIVEDINKFWSIKAKKLQGSEDDFLKSLLTSPRAIFYTGYKNFVYPFFIK